MKKFIAFLLVFGILLSPSLSANTSSGKDSVKKIGAKTYESKAARCYTRQCS